MSQFDLIVIGAGPGGYVAAIKAAQLGKKVAVIEKDKVGGTCLNRGCVPTKALVHASSVLEEIKKSEELGVVVGDVSVDFARMQERKAAVVEKLRSGVESLFKANGIELYRGAGNVIDPHTVQVNEETLSADFLLLATGSYPAKPPIPGLDLPGVVTSDEMLEGEGVDTKNLLIIGGGVIGVEFATIYHALGAQVTIVEAMDRILPTMDKEISQNLSMILKRRGIKINTGAMVESIEEKDGLTVHFTAKEKAQEVSADKVLVSIGRRAATADLLPESMDLKMQRGYIPVNENYETCISGVYAIGDIVMGGIQLAHAASAEGVNAVCSMFGEKAPKDCSVIPSCIFTEPEIASCGITEAEAKEKGIPVVIGKSIMSANSKTVIESGDRGFIKIVFHAQTKEVLGAQLMCKRATDMLGALTDAVVNHLTLSQMSATVWPHPTFSEAIGEAIEDLEGGAIHAAPKKKKA